MFTYGDYKKQFEIGRMLAGKINAPANEKEETRPPNWREHENCGNCRHCPSAGVTDFCTKHLQTTYLNTVCDDWQSNRETDNTRPAPEWNEK